MTSGERAQGIAEVPGSSTAGAGPVAGRGGGPLTIGAEEEYLLVDPDTRALRPEAQKVVAEAAGELGDRVTTEITAYQIEVRTEPHTSLERFAQEVRFLRGAVVRAAARHGLGVISSGTPVLAHAMPPAMNDGPRYARSTALFGALDDEQSICACHLHVGIPSVELALQVSNHIRTRLPVLIALAANSPFWQGRDTGYASWRRLAWARWPAAGPPPHFESPAHFEALVADFTATETILDRGGLYWDIRPSHHVPTLEIRVADAAATARDTVTLAAVVRALVATALADIDAGKPASRPPAHLLRTACWRAARDGLAGDGVDLDSRRLVPATVLVERLLTELRPALLLHGDLDTVLAGYARQRVLGTGADRQRAALGRRGSYLDVVDDLMGAMTAVDEVP